MLVGTPARSAKTFEKMCGGRDAAGRDSLSADSMAKNLTDCGFPRSRTVKSSFFRSVTGAPCSSWTTTFT